MKDLNIVRIIWFTVILILAHVLIGALIPSFEEFEEPSVRVLMLVFQYLIDAVVVIAIFSKLAKLQFRLLYVHVGCVVVLYQIISVSLMLVLFGQLATVSTIQFILDWSVFGVSIIVGTEIGRRLHVATRKEQRI
ncbi:MAG: hypothetical protein K2W88_13180 [Pararheinheimera sp.]|nr:hypothetical protein [Rheinheimera sp.]